MTAIHPTAIVEPGAQLGADCEIHAHAIIRRGAILGDRVVVHPFAVVAGDPQDLKFKPGTKSFAKVGSGSKIREHVTINTGTTEGSTTVIGENCLLMACSHVAHDCVVGDGAILANNVLLAGHVHVEDNAILGGGAAFHQFVRVGEGSMVGGLSRITLDVPRYSMTAERDELAGLNLVGLRRRGVNAEGIRQIKEAFRAVYAAGNVREHAAAALAGPAFTAPEARRFLEFFTGGKRGFARPPHGRAGVPDDAG
ncbi:MAG TPA: acyl-ACP--UDP-N-acetylglucosamine O-acyltransferase [Opitutaceae bacterium]|nr:acyl-ACP--UDP-N-acetylglucosamine O-acyltransferase [Opitutaceae bacterium]